LSVTSSEKMRVFFIFLYREVVFRNAFSILFFAREDAKKHSS